MSDIHIRPGVEDDIPVILTRIAMERGCTRMEWAVLDWNTPSIEFYKSLGAVPMDEWTIFRLTAPAIGRLAER